MKILLFTALLFVSFQASATSTKPYPQTYTQNNAQVGGDNAAQVTLDNRHDAVSASAATLMIPGCNSGASAQTESGGLGLSQRSPSCVNIDGINAAMRLADFYRRQAKLCPDDPSQQAHLHVLAHMAIDDAEYYQGLQKALAGDRAKTGWINAWFTDTALPFIAGGGLLYLLLAL